MHESHNRKAALTRHVLNCYRKLPVHRVDAEQDAKHDDAGNAVSRSRRLHGSYGLHG
jgi:hypothetical protein